MPLREHVFARFRPVARGLLRLDDESSDAFAAHLANANESIHVVSQLCLGANALRSETLDVMLERWFRTLPEYLPVRQAMRARPGEALQLPALEPGAALLLHARVFEVAVSRRGLSESDALAVAGHVKQAAAPFWLLAQRSASTERKSQRDLGALLRAALGLPLDHALEGARLYLATGAA